MAEVTELAKVGAAMGLSGAELKTWVTEQQAIERDKRAEQREIQREKAQMQAKLCQEQREIQREKAEMQERIQKQNIELLKWKGELEEKMQRERLEIEREKLKMEEKKGESSQKAICKAKIPVFNEENDKMDVYLSRFESVANLMQWKMEDWPLQLSVLLTGNALETFYGLTNDQQKDYAVVKEALLRRYCMTEEGFRKELFGTKLLAGETPTQFAARIERLFDN